MAATFTVNAYTGASAAAKTAGISNWNLQSIDAHDGTGSDHTTNTVTKLVSGTNYSYEKWMKAEFNGTFTSVTNVKVWASVLSLSDVNLAINAGETTTGATPVDTVSAIATATVPTTEGTAIDITPAGGITVAGTETDFLVAQLVVPDTVTTAGSIGTQTLTFQYDEV